MSATLLAWAPSHALIQTPSGSSVGIFGLALSQLDPPVTGISLGLRQGEIAVDASFVTITRGLRGLRPPGQRKHLGPVDGGFFVSAMFPESTRLAEGDAEIEMIVERGDDRRDVLRLPGFSIVDARPSGQQATSRAAPGKVGIALATYNPDDRLFLEQIRSIQRQTHANWVCVIADDNSRHDRYAMMRSVIGGDDRFKIIRNARNVGFYRNFEIACSALPSDCEFIAFSDQDDVWLDDKIETQLKYMTDDPRSCTFSDASIVDSQYRLIFKTFWVDRRWQFGSLTGLVLANVATGMTMLSRRELVVSSLPFPALPSVAYHDHWLAMMAAASGSLTYVPLPLVKYVQHGTNHTGLTAPPIGFLSIVKSAMARGRDYVSAARTGTVRAMLARSPTATFWFVLEPARLQILTRHLQVRGDRSLRRDALDRVLTSVHDLGLLSLVASGANWRDRYRRTVAVELVVGRWAQRLAGFFDAAQVAVQTEISAQQQPSCVRR